MGRQQSAGKTGLRSGSKKQTARSGPPRVAGASGKANLKPGQPTKRSTRARRRAA
jgi:hypothetical protein